MRRSIRHLVLTAAAAAVATVSATTAGAQAPTPRDGLHVGRTPVATFFEMNSVGWFYTPTTSFQLTSVLTQFADVRDLAEAIGVEVAHREVFVDIYEASAASVAGLGASALATGSFNSASAVGQLGGATFANAVTLNANALYFIGFRNIGYLDPANWNGVLGVNFTDDPNAADVGRTGGLLMEDAVAGTGPYTYQLEGEFAGAELNPVLQLVGTDVPSGPPPVTTTPEPASVALLGAGLAGLAAARARRRTARV
jgi:hypothetical protein